MRGRATISVVGLTSLRQKATEFNKSVDSYRQSQSSENRSDLEKAANVLLSELIYFVGQEKVDFARSFLLRPVVREDEKGPPTDSK